MPSPGEYLRLHPLLHNRRTETKKYGLKDRSKLQKKLSDEEIANISDAEFKTLVTGMLTEMVECGHKIKEEVMAIQIEIKENVQGTNSDGKETGTQPVWTRRKKETFDQNRMKKQEFKKNEERLRNFSSNLKHSNIQIMRVPERQEKEQEIENLFENIMKENFPNVAKEIDFQEVQEAQSPKEAGPKEEHTKAYQNYITQD